jgi:hypothetical protein
MSLAAAGVVERHVDPPLQDLGDIPIGFTVTGYAELRRAVHVVSLQEQGCG